MSENTHTGPDYWINHWGHTNVRWGPFSHTRSQDFLWACSFFSEMHFSSLKKLTTFLVVVTFKPTLNVQTFERQNSVVKIWQLIGAPWRRGPLPWYNWHNGSSGPVLVSE